MTHFNSAGTDTSSSLLSSIIYALVMHPEVLQKAQRQLATVVPSGSLPTFDDEPALPYISAIILETMRWAPTVPTGLAHLCTEETTYRGWRIPAGTIVIGNAWAMLHNEVSIMPSRRAPLLTLFRKHTPIP